MELIYIIQIVVMLFVFGPFVFLMLALALANLFDVGWAQAVVDWAENSLMF